MANKFMEILGGLNLGVNFTALILILVLIGLGGLFYLLYNKWVNGPRIYPSIVFEKAGGSWRERQDIKIERYRDGTMQRSDTKELVNFDLTEAYMDKKGKIKFVLAMVDEILVPMTIAEKINNKDDKKNYDIAQFVGKASIRNLKQASVESVDRDSNTFAWFDKIQHLIAPMASLIVVVIAMVMLSMGARHNVETANQNAVSVAEIQKAVEAMKTNNEIMKQFLTDYHEAVPPPG